MSQFNLASAFDQEIEAQSAPLDFSEPGSLDAVASQLFAQTEAEFVNDRGGATSEVHQRARQILEMNRSLSDPDLMKDPERWDAVVGQLDDNTNIAARRQRLDEHYANMKRNRVEVPVVGIGWEMDTDFTRKPKMSDYELALAAAKEEIYGPGLVFRGPNPDIEYETKLRDKARGLLPTVTDPITGARGLGQFSDAPGSLQLGDFAGAVADTSVGQLGTAIAGTIAFGAKATGNDDVEQEFRQYRQEFNEQMRQRQESTRNPVATMVGGAIGSVTSSLGPSMFLKAKSAAMAAYGLLSFGNGSADYNESMRVKGVEPNLWDEAVHGVASMFIEVVTESLGLDAVTKFAPGVASKFISNLKPGRLKNAAGYAVEMGVGASTNAVEETLAEIMNNSREKYGVPLLAEATDPERELFDGIFEAGQQGGIGGAFLSAAARFGRLRRFGGWDDAPRVREFWEAEKQRERDERNERIRQWLEAYRQGQMTEGPGEGVGGSISTSNAVQIGNTVINLPSEPGYTTEQFTAAVDSAREGLETIEDIDAEIAQNLAAKAAQAVAQASQRVGGRQEWLRKARGLQGDVSREDAKELGITGKTNATERKAAVQAGIQIAEALPEETPTDQQGEIEETEPEEAIEDIPTGEESGPVDQSTPEQEIESKESAPPAKARQEEPVDEQEQFRLDAAKELGESATDNEIMVNLDRVRRGKKMLPMASRVEKGGKAATMLSALQRAISSGRKGAKEEAIAFLEEAHRVAVPRNRVTNAVKKIADEYRAKQEADEEPADKFNRVSVPGDQSLIDRIGVSPELRDAIDNATDIKAAAKEAVSTIGESDAVRNMAVNTAIAADLHDAYVMDPLTSFVENLSPEDRYVAGELIQQAAGLDENPVTDGPDAIEFLDLTFSEVIEFARNLREIRDQFPEYARVGVDRIVQNILGVPREPNTSKAAKKQPKQGKPTLLGFTVENIAKVFGIREKAAKVSVKIARAMGLDLDRMKVAKGNPDSPALYQIQFEQDVATEVRYHLATAKAVQLAVARKMESRSGTDWLDWIKRQPGVKAAEVAYFEAALSGRDDMMTPQQLQELHQASVAEVIQVTGQRLRSPAEYANHAAQNAAEDFINDLEPEELQEVMEIGGEEIIVEIMAMLMMEAVQIGEASVMLFERLAKNAIGQLLGDSGLDSERIESFTGYFYDQIAEYADNNFDPQAMMVLDEPEPGQPASWGVFDQNIAAYDIESYREVLIRVPESMGKFYETIHYPFVRNIALHIRAHVVKTMDGKRYLFIEEIQSDWAQQRRQGIAAENTTDAPFDTGQWANLGLHKAIQDAVDEGLDGVAIVGPNAILARTGSNQAVATFYEKGLSNALKKIASRSGVKTEMDTTLSVANWAPIEVSAVIEFNDKMRTRFGEGFPLFQQAKAAVTFAESGDAVIYAMDQPDESSVIHELAHVARRQLLNRNVPQEHREGITDEDIAVTEEWAGAENGNWTREAEEKFARGFERYLRDGKLVDKAPGVLGKVFAAAAKMLRAVYESVKGSDIDVDISPAMERVYERLLTRAARNARAKKPVAPKAKFRLQDAMERGVDVIKTRDQTNLRMDGKGVKVAKNESGTYDAYVTKFVNRQPVRSYIAQNVTEDEALIAGTDALAQGSIRSVEGGLEYGQKFDPDKQPHKFARKDWVERKLEGATEEQRQDPVFISNLEMEYHDAIRRAAKRGEVSLADAKALSPEAREIARGADPALDQAFLEEIVADLERKRSEKAVSDFPLVQFAIEFADSITRHEPGSKADRKQWKSITELLQALAVAKAQIAVAAQKESRSGKKGGKNAKMAREIDRAIDRIGNAFNRAYKGEDFGWSYDAEVPVSLRENTSSNMTGNAVKARGYNAPESPLEARRRVEYGNTPAGSVEDRVAVDAVNSMKREIEAIIEAKTGSKVEVQVGKVAPSGALSEFFGYSYWTDTNGNVIDAEIVMQAWLNTRGFIGGASMPSGFIMGAFGAAAVIALVAGGTFGLGAGMAAIPFIASRSRVNRKKPFSRSKAYENLRDEPKRRLGNLRRRPEADRRQAMKEWFSGAWGVVTRPTRDLPNIARWAVAREALRLFKDIDTRAVDRASRDISAIVAGLDDVQYETFNLIVLARNLMESVDRNEPLRFGFVSQDEVAMFLADLMAEAASMPGVLEALDRRKEIIVDRVEQLVALGLLPEDALDRTEHYMHQEVVKYAALNRRFGMTGLERRKSSFQKGRIQRESEEIGDSLPEEYDYLTDYVESEVAWLMDAHAGMDRERIMAMIGQYDMYAQLHEQAKEENRKRLLAGNEDAVAQMKDQLRSMKRGTKKYKELRKKIIDLDPTFEFSSQRGRSLALLAQLAREGHIPQGRFDISLLTRSNLSSEELDQRTQFIQWLASLSADGNEKLGQAIGTSKKWLGTFGKEQAAIRQALGRNFVTVQTLAHDLEGYEMWSPEPGNVFYKGWSLPDRVVEELERQGLENLPEGYEITKDDLRQVTILAGKRKPMILPAEIVSELERLDNNLSGSMPEQFAEMSAKLMSRWKQWTLTNPFRVVAYNMRNITGDLDPVMWSAPGAFKYFKQAFGIATDYFYRDKTSDVIEEMLDHSLLSSSQISQEFPNIRETKELEKLFGSFNPANPGDWWSKYFSIAGKATEWREHTTRIAAYLFYRDKLMKGELKNYGASKKETVDALVESLGVPAAAAHMARNLVGDYGNITVMGDAIRNHIIPFWSWQEINIRRTRRIVINNWKQGAQGKVHALAGLAALPVRIGVAAMLYSRMLSFYLATHAWNYLMFGEDEEELSEYDRGGVHILLGRTGDGSIRIFRNVGAMGDLMQWFGINDLVSLWPAIANGQLGTADVLIEMGKSPFNKVVGGLNPFAKGALETATGFTTFPDVFEVRRQDRLTTLTGVLGLSDIGNEVRGILLKDGSHARPNFWWRQFVGITDPRQITLGKIYTAQERFLRQKGEATSNVFGPSPFSAIRKAVQHGNYEAFLQAKAEYEKSGRSYKNLLQSLSRLDPMTSLKTEYRDEFIEFLSGDQRAVYDDARRYAREIESTTIAWWMRSEREAGGVSAVTREIEQAKIASLAGHIAKERPLLNRVDRFNWEQTARAAKADLQMRGMSDQGIRRVLYRLWREQYTPETAREKMRLFSQNWRLLPSVE